MALTPAQIVNTLAPIVGRVGAAGIAGNLQQESSDNPASAGGGLAQWQGSRYTGLVKYAQSRGLPATSAQAALGYLAQDLKGPYSGLAQQLRGAKNPGHAAVLFSNIYERPGTPMIQNRISYAQQALGAKGGGMGASLGNLAAAPPSAMGAQQTTTGLDQAAFDKAQKAYVAGTFLSQSEKSNPYGSDGPNPLLTSGLLTTKAPNPGDYQKAFTTATAKLQQIAGTPLVNVHPSAKGYVNPVPGAVIGRTDMGVDVNLKPGAPIRAIGNSRVVNIYPNWYRGQPYVLLQLLDGPQKDRYYYVAEQIAPRVRPGQTVRAGQPIGTYANSGTGIEIGWGTPGSQTLAQATGRDNAATGDHANTPAGINFRSFLGGLK